MSRQTPIDQIPLPDPEAALVTRDQARRILGVSYHTVVHLEEAGRLRVVRLFPKAKSTALYNIDDVMTLTKQYSESLSNGEEVKAAYLARKEAKLKLKNKKKPARRTSKSEAGA
jgi:hypothetical protein